MVLSRSVIASRTLLNSSIPKNQLIGNENLRKIFSQLTLTVRSFSNEKGSGSSSHNEDPFGVNFQDSSDETSGNIGPRESLPPQYIRDETTGKFTGEIKGEVSEQDRQLLNLGGLAKERMVAFKFEKSISKADTFDTSSSSTHSMANIARRIREESITLNTIGRKVSDVSETAPDGEVEFPPSAPLSASEMESLKKYMKKTSHGDDISKKVINEADDLIPSVARMSSDKTGDQRSDEENPDLDLEWMSASAQRTMLDVDREDLDDPFSHLMPSDLNPAKKVNRRRAKPIPTELIHHNNLALLRRYVTPGGQIMNRVQSRLGAKDQRKVAKLIKRARHLGLIPVLGQWKVEDHGSVKDPTLLEEKDWEKKLLERGFVERNSAIWNKDKSTTW
jgi:small subunit ribosomal protein S18